MKTLLLADDSVTIQRVIELTFAHEDVRVVSVGDGRRAVQWMDTDRPDIVLVDVEVPEVDGYAVAAHVKQSARLKNVPVVLLAGAFEPVDHDRARSVGCDAVLVKPFEPQQLVSRVKALLDGDQARRSHEGDSGTVTPFPVAARGAVVQASAEATVSDSETRKPMRPARENSAAGPTPVEPREPAVPSKKSLVNAFSALLAGEQTNPPTPALGTPMAAPAGWAAAPSDAALEEAVRRVLGRMTEEQVRRIVVETAERLIREEIEKIKASPE